MGKVIGIDLGTTNSCVAVIDGRTYSPSQVSAFILQKMVYPTEDERDRGILSRPEGRSGSDHRSGLLQRRTALGNEGYEQDRRG